MRTSSVSTGAFDFGKTIFFPAIINLGFTRLSILLISVLVNCEDVGTGITPDQIQARNITGKLTVFPRRKRTLSFSTIPCSLSNLALLHT